jgi:hypothetical protein
MHAMRRLKAPKRLPKYDPEDYKDAKILNLDPRRYANCGLYFKFADIPRPEVLAQKTLHEQAKYADAITKRYAKNKEFLSRCFTMPLKFPKYVNGTSIGNIAFMRVCNMDNALIKKAYDIVIEVARK